MESLLLSINDLTTQYITDNNIIHAVNGISLELSRGGSIGLVGESGAGKTTTAYSIMGLLPKLTGKIIKGSILFEGKDLTRLSEEEMRDIRGSKISMIFQDPMTSLNPIITVGDQIAEVLEIHGTSNKNEAQKKAGDMLEMVGIPRGRMNEYPHQFSGGMKQRVIIAIALACNPELLIADEPTTALDVTIQAQVLKMIKELKNELDTSLILISHNLGVVAQVCENVAIMYAGRIVEFGALRDVFSKPLHPYTEGLLNSIPRIEVEKERLIPIRGMMPDPSIVPSGCIFKPRCPYAKEECSVQAPIVSKISDRRVMCLMHEGVIPNTMGAANE
ncbi:oligopeptide transporter subunit; ATP-binding component of ABC superfamily [uncultured Spirochaetota bacterium]|jgi:peptide/nickel transport system ATP-binding protein|uniref:Oligopeptide transporter subunit ATP-binding component of ABC superfamily n=1 Tax=uncultured Spirochaetota bacterium TaxID=460511 RepID=A0A652ZSZ6_9SPIR|nr:oligopeptide transporter subunit; ATP-binding component of ABC superfamily [uncultured Spirochaetota bacterium]